MTRECACLFEVSLFCLIVGRRVLLRMLALLLVPLLCMCSYFDWRTATLMAVRINQWKLHVQVRGSHCEAPFPDPNCYNSGFENATGVAAMDTGSCAVVGPLDVVPASGCVPMLVNLDTDPGEAQLRTLICPPEEINPGPTKGQLEPRCHTQAEIQPILTALWTLYNVSNCRGEPECDLWAQSEIGTLMHKLSRLD